MSALGWLGNGGKDPQVNKFEQVSALGHQMSLVGGRSRVGGLLRRLAGDRYDEVQCLMGNGHMGAL